MGAFEHSAEDRWVDDQAGPVVRPYAVTQGRARPTGAAIDMVAMVTAVGQEAPSGQPGLGPEHLDIVRRCQGSHASVAEIAAQVNLPLGTVRVLLGDLLAQGLVQIQDVATLSFSDDVLEAVLDGLRTL
jgi:hypothetical protein